MTRLFFLFALIGLVFYGSTAAFADPAGPATPPNIQKILDKLAAGQQPTPAEQKALTAWGESMGGISAGSADAQAISQAQASAPKGEEFEVGSGEDQNPCHKAGKAIGFGAVPSRDAYVATAKDAMRTYRGHLAPDVEEKLDDILQKSSSPAFGAELAVLLVAHGNGSAAVVAAAYAAQKTPDDAVTANDLGAILRGMHDYARAGVALQYAKSKAPDSPVIASNLGWLAISQGDNGTAGKFFNAAMAKNGQLSAALLGQGLVQQCAGHPAQALPLFRRSIATGFSELAAAGIESAETDIAHSKNPGADNGSPAVYYGPKAPDGNMPDWSDPPFPKDPGQLDSMMRPGCPNGALCQYENYWVQVVAAQPDGDVKHPSTIEDGNTLRFTRGYDKEDFVLGDIRRMMNVFMTKTNLQWANAVQKARASTGCASCAYGVSDGARAQEMADKVNKCLLRPLAIAAHTRLYPDESPLWTEQRKEFADLYAFAKPWMARIHDPSTLNKENRDTVTLVAATGGAFAASSTSWGDELSMDYNAEGCGAGPSQPPVKLKPLKPYKIDPTACRSGTMSMNFGLANLNADCDHMTLTFGEELVGAAEWKFAPDYTRGPNGVLVPAAPDWSNDQITIFAGLGKSGYGTLTANAAAGGFVTLQNGHLIDGGAQVQGGLTLGNGGDLDKGARGDETPLTGAAGFVARISVISGPDVTTTAGTRVGGNCGVSC